MRSCHNPYLLLNQKSSIFHRIFDRFKNWRYWMGRLGIKRYRGFYIEGKPITIPTFKIVDFPIIRISEIKTRRFNIVDRAQIRAKEALGGLPSLLFHGRPSVFHIRPADRSEDADIFRAIADAVHQNT